MSTFTFAFAGNDQSHAAEKKTVDVEKMENEGDQETAAAPSGVEEEKQEGELDDTVETVDLTKIEEGDEEEEEKRELLSANQSNRHIVAVNKRLLIS